MTRATRPEPERPATPTSANTDPAEPDPAQQNPIKPAPTEPEPSQPDFTEPDPAEPAQPAPPEPEPTERAPAEPETRAADRRTDRISAAAQMDDELLQRAAAGDADVEVLVAATRPKYAAFIGTGVMLGFVTAVILTWARPANPEYTANSVLSYLSLVFGLLGGSAGGMVAVILDWRSERAARGARRRRQQR